MPKNILRSILIFICITLIFFSFSKPNPFKSKERLIKVDWLLHHSDSNLLSYVILLDSNYNKSHAVEIFNNEPFDLIALDTIRINLNDSNVATCSLPQGIIAIRSKVNSVNYVLKKGDFLGWQMIGKPKDATDKTINPFRYWIDGKQMHLNKNLKRYVDIKHTYHHAIFIQHYKNGILIDEFTQGLISN
ncbi:hypothetical protein EON78_00135, partial [bacterium]